MEDAAFDNRQRFWCPLPVKEGFVSHSIKNWPARVDAVKEGVEEHSRLFWFGEPFRALL